MLLPRVIPHTFMQKEWGDTVSFPYVCFDNFFFKLAAYCLLKLL